MLGLKRSLRTAPATTVVALSWTAVLLGGKILESAFVPNVLATLLTVPFALPAYLSLLAAAPFRGGFLEQSPYLRGAVLFAAPATFDLVLALVRWYTDRLYFRLSRRPE